MCSDSGAATVATVAAGSLQMQDRPATPDVASEVVRLQDQVPHLQAQLATRASEGVLPSGLPR